MLTKTGFNIIDVADKADILRTLEQVRPPAVLFYASEASFAAQVKTKFPEMEVIIRFWPDEDNHKRYTPQQFLSMHTAETRHGLILYTNNESGIGDDVLDWNYETCALAVERTAKVVALNPAAGTYDKKDLYRLRKLFELAGLRPDVITIGLHEYAGGVITSGMYRPEDMDKHTSAISWPTRKELDDLFPWHVGRNRMITDYCRSLGIKLPRLAITETGFDWTSDISGWLGARVRTPGYESIDGWKSLKDQWHIWWPDWTPEMAFIKQMQYAETNLWRDIAYTLLYCWGNDGNKRWLPFRVDNTRIVTYMEGQPQVPDVAPEPVVTPPVVIESPVVVVTPPKPVVDTLPAEVPAVNPALFKLVASVEGTKATIDALKAMLDGYNALAKLNNLPVLSIQVQ
jgi:hypothetical protein